MGTNAVVSDQVIQHRSSRAKSRGAAPSQSVRPSTTLGANGFVDLHQPTERHPKSARSLP
jgi:hypothetical protein